MRWCIFGTDFFVCDCEKLKMYWMYIEFFGKKQAGKDVSKMCRRINQWFLRKTASKTAAFAAGVEATRQADAAQPLLPGTQSRKSLPNQAVGNLRIIDAGHRLFHGADTGSGTVPDAVGKNPVLHPNPVRCQHVPARRSILPAR